MHGPLYYTRRWRRVDGVMSPAETRPRARGSTGGRYNQKGGWTVVVRVVVVLAGRGALVSCTVGFRRSARRNASRDSWRSNFTFGQTCPQVKRTRAASPNAQAMEIARRRRRCRGCCPSLASLAASDMVLRSLGDLQRRGCVVAPWSISSCVFLACVGRARTAEHKSDLELVCI